MRLSLLLVLLCALGAAPVRADAPARPGDAPPVGRRTGRMPARIEVVPPGSGTAPTHLVITIPRERLRGVLDAPGTVGRLDEADALPDAPRPRVFRHVVAAGFLALAVLSVPFVWGGRWRGGTTAAGVVAALALAGAALIAADIAAPRPRPRPGQAPAPTPAPGGTPQTVEVIIVPGAGPLRVQVTYARP